MANNNAATKKRRVKLNFDYETSLFIFALASHQADYRLSWSLNEHLGIELTRQKNNDDFQWFLFFDETKNAYFKLIPNFNDTGLLLKKYKNIDFFLLIHFLDDTTINSHTYTKQLKKVPRVLIAFEIPYQELKPSEKKRLGIY